jgi:nucleoside diphosphate kinase
MNDHNYESNKIETEITTETLAQKVSLLMTKPENTDTEAPLLLFLKNNGLNAKAFRYTLSEEMLKALYPDIQNLPEVWQATKDHMLGKEVEVFLVTKDSENISDKNVVDQLVDLVGKETEPEKNEHGTLRKHLSGETKILHSETGKIINYFENGFHRPTNPEELFKNLEIFGLLDEVNKI